eukprot:227398-Alexandrium_andersonii.AAC.1
MASSSAEHSRSKATCRSSTCTVASPVKSRPARTMKRHGSSRDCWMARSRPSAVRTFRLAIR